MNKEFKQNILKAIKNNTVTISVCEEKYCVYELRGKDNILLMQIDYYESNFPRSVIYINGEAVAHLNHFARTRTQIKQNYDILHIANAMFQKYAEQKGLFATSMTKQEFLLSNFLRQHSQRKY